jgi:hypothetical protein
MGPNGGSVATDSEGGLQCLALWLAVAALWLAVAAIWADRQGKGPSPSWYTLHPLGSAHLSELQQIFEAASNLRLEMEKLAIRELQGDLLMLPLLTHLFSHRSIPLSPENIVFL